MANITKKIKSIIPSIKTKHLSGLEPAVLFVIKSCCQHFKSSDNIPPKLVFLIQSSLDRMHERLNMGHWKDVPLNDRRSITVLCFFKVLAFLESNDSSLDNIINGAFKIIDNGLLFGAPLAQIQGDLLHQCANLLSLWKLQKNSSDNTADSSLSKVNEKHTDIPNKHSTHTLAAVCCASEADWEDMTSKSSNSKCSDSSRQFNFGITLKKDICPSMETFNWRYFASKTPIVLLDCITHWPAMKLWPDMNYILSKAGHRTVPIELGSKYTDKDWTQKLMTVKDFIQKQILSKQPTIGYLAQHQLFNQISELAADIKEPEYCCLREDESLPEEETDINAWFGPCGTISPLHFDPKHNLLAQVVGEKLVILFSPKDSSYLYCHPDNLLQNTAQVDPTQPDFELHPEFKNATPYFCILKPGEMLYIPPNWWHYVKSLSISFSVSFWWN